MKQIKDFKIVINQKFKNNNQRIINKYYFFDEKNYYKYYWTTDIEMNNNMENIFKSGTTLIEGKYYKTIKRLLKLILTDLNDDTLEFDGVLFIINYTNNVSFSVFTPNCKNVLETFQSIFKLKKGGETIANSNKHKNS